MSEYFCAVQLGVFQPGFLSTVSGPFRRVGAADQNPNAGQVFDDHCAIEGNYTDLLVGLFNLLEGRCGESIERNKVTIDGSLLFFAPFKAQYAEELAQIGAAHLLGVCLAFGDKPSW